MKRRKVQHQFFRATTNLAEQTTNLRKQTRRRTRSTQHAQKRARRGHARGGRGSWPGMRWGAAKNPKKEEEEGNAAGNQKQLVRNHVGGSHGWGNENAPTSAPRTLGIPRGVAGRLTKQLTTLPEEGNALRAGTTEQELHRVVMRGNRMLHNTVGVGNVMVGVTGTAAAPTSG